MKKSLLLFLVIAVALSFGCGKKEEAQKADAAVKEKAQKTEKVFTPAERPYPRKAEPGEKLSPQKVILVDAVTGENFLSGETPYSYLYKGKTYLFKTEENLKLFKQDPQKYIMKTE
jgi:YHS domain-containing protein